MQLAPSSPIVCLGEMLWDCLADQPDRSEAEVLSWTEYPGGAPANVACALGRLGSKSAFLGCLGEDAPGEALLETLKHDGVDTRGVQRSFLPTRKVYVTRTRSGERHFSSFGGLPADGFADTQLAADALEPAGFKGAPFLLIGSLMMAFPTSARAVERALNLADARLVKVFLDVNWRPVFWSSGADALQVVYLLIEHADVLKVSEEDAEWLGLASVEAIAERFDHLEGIFLTRGAGGCKWMLGGERGEHLGFRVAAVDTTGAGDAFVAALLRQLSLHPLRTWGKGAAQMVEYASAAGALCTLKPGAIAAAPTEAQVQDFLKARV